MPADNHSGPSGELNLIQGRVRNPCTLHAHLDRWKVSEHCAMLGVISHLLTSPILLLVPMTVIATPMAPHPVKNALLAQGSQRARMNVSSAAPDRLRLVVGALFMCCEQGTYASNFAQSGCTNFFCRLR